MVLSFFGFLDWLISPLNSCSVSQFLCAVYFSKYDSSTLSQISESISISQNVCEPASIGLICSSLLVFDLRVITLLTAMWYWWSVLSNYLAQSFWGQTGQKLNPCKVRETCSAISASSLYLLLEHFCTAFQQTSNSGDEESLSKCDFQLLIGFIVKNSCLTSSLN